MKKTGNAVPCHTGVHTQWVPSPQSAVLSTCLPTQWNFLTCRQQMSLLGLDLKVPKGGRTYRAVQTNHLRTGRTHWCSRSTAGRCRGPRLLHTRPRLEHNSTAVSGPDPQTTELVPCHHLASRPGLFISPLTLGPEAKQLWGWHGHPWWGRWAATSTCPPQPPRAYQPAESGLQLQGWLCEPAHMDRLALKGQDAPEQAVATRPSRQRGMGTEA